MLSQTLICIQTLSETTQIHPLSSPRPGGLGWPQPSPGSLGEDIFLPPVKSSFKKQNGSQNTFSCS